MPSFTLTAHSTAPVEEVWKLLHNPARFPEWWDGIETVAEGTGGDYTMWPAGYPDFPMAQRLETSDGGGRVTISCLVSDLIFRRHRRRGGTARTRGPPTPRPATAAREVDRQPGRTRRPRGISRARETSSSVGIVP
jgi:hypothetical protein